MRWPTPPYTARIKSSVQTCSTSGGWRPIGRNGEGLLPSTGRHPVGVGPQVWLPHRIYRLEAGRYFRGALGLEDGPIWRQETDDTP